MKKILLLIVGIAAILLIVLALVRTGTNTVDPIAQRAYAEAALVDARASARYDNAMASVLIVNGMIVPGVIAIISLLLSVALVVAAAYFIYKSIHDKPKPPIIYVTAGQTIEQLPVQQKPLIIPVGQYAANHESRTLVD